MTAIKVLLVSNAGWNLYNYRLPIARALRSSGADVALVCPPDEYANALHSSGFPVIDWTFDRRSLNVLREGVAIARLVRIYRREKPDLVNHFTIKPNMYGWLAARSAGVPKIVNTWTGLGFVFAGSRVGSALKLAATPLLKMTARSRSMWSIFQIDSDRDVMVRHGFASPTRSTVISGSGVDTARFTPDVHPETKRPVVLMASRLLWDKGVREFVDAARLLRQRNVNVDFQIAGSPDKGNLNSLTERDVEELQRNGTVTFLGQRNDMPSLLRTASIAVLPTYYNEGVPRFLLEAAATGKPIVATDAPGCSVAVDHNVNGLLVGPRDPAALADAVAALLADPGLRARMGEAGRRMAVERFDEKLIVAQYLDVYARHGLPLGEA